MFVCTCVFRWFMLTFCWFGFFYYRFHFTKRKTLNDHLQLLVPNEFEAFLNDLQDSKFIECNLTRAKLFKKTYGESLNMDGVRFKHKAWKILTKAKTVLDMLSIPFWLSSGTCLGIYFLGLIIFFLITRC